MIHLKEGRSGNPSRFEIFENIQASLVKIPIQFVDTTKPALSISIRTRPIMTYLISFYKLYLKERRNIIVMLVFNSVITSKGEIIFVEILNS